MIATSAADLEWTDLALCTQVDGEIFYPHRGEATEAAKALCRSCEARLPCLAYSIEMTDREGIFAGFTERARRKIEHEHAAGKSLEDITAEDDARFYARIEKFGTVKQRQLAAERRRRKAKRDRRTANQPVQSRRTEAA